MLKKEQNGLSWFEFESLQEYPEVSHAILCRSDDPTSLLGGIKLKLANQVHKDSVCRIDDAFDHTTAAPNTDALITNAQNVALGIRHADCQAAIFFDPKQRAVACIHAGWRGNCQNIYKKTIDEMAKQYGSLPENLICCIGPSLGPENSEFINYRQEFPESFWPFQHRENYFNLWEIARWQLESAGVTKLEFANICTYENPDLFFSYRRDKTIGRNLTVVWLT